MARYNEILVGRFNRLLQKYLGLKGEPPAPQLSSEIMTVLQLFGGREELYLQGIDLFGKQVTNSVVGQNSAFRLRNPVGSGAILVVESLIVGVGANETVTVFDGVSNTDENVVTSAGGNFDSRGRPNSTGIVSFNNAAPASTTGLNPFYGEMLLSANPPSELVNTVNQEIPILPGSLIVVTGSVAATNLFTSLRWRERVLEESERS